MKILKREGIYDIAFESGGIVFYAISNDDKKIDEIEQVFINISEQEEQELILLLTKIFNTRKPNDSKWGTLVAGKGVIFYLDGYNIMVMLP